MVEQLRRDLAASEGTISQLRQELEAERENMTWQEAAPVTPAAGNAVCAPHVACSVE